VTLPVPVRRGAPPAGSGWVWIDTGVGAKPARARRGSRPAVANEMADVIEEYLVADRQLAIGLREFNHDTTSPPPADALFGQRMQGVPVDLVGGGEWQLVHEPHEARML